MLLADCINYYLACMHICFMWSLKVNFSSMIAPNILLAVTYLMVLFLILRLSLYLCLFSICGTILVKQLSLFAYLITNLLVL